MSQPDWDHLSNPHEEIEENPSSEIKNPLLIDVILNGIFQYLQVEDLKKCRAVCSLWNSSVLASASWKRQVEVYFGPYTEEDRAIEAFSKLVEMGNGECFSEIYSIHIFEISKLFQHECGTWIKILRLRFVKFESKDEFRTVVYKACPNMEQLSLNCIEIEQSEIEQVDGSELNECLVPKFGKQKNMKYLAVCPGNNFIISASGVAFNFEVMWMELFSNFPNLEALHLLCVIRNVSLSGFFNSLSKVQQEFSTKLKLKHISVNTPYEDLCPGFLQVLKDPDLELETINTSHFSEPDDLHEVLSIHASSLKKLSFRCSHNGTIDPHEIFPLQSAKFAYCGLDALQVLEVGSNPFLSLSVLKFTPNLRMLEISGLDDTIIENTQMSEMGGISMKKCKRLILDVRCMSLESLRKLRIWLPYVEELQLKWVENAHLPMIFESWPGLVAFAAYYVTVDDMGITGLDEEDVRKINDNGESSSWRPITVPRANISALKDLRSLYIGASCDRIPIPELGHCAAVCGVELVPKLERLWLRRFKLEGSTWERLQSRFPKADDHLRLIQDLSDFFWD